MHTGYALIGTAGRTSSNTLRAMQTRQNRGDAMYKMGISLLNSRVNGNITTVAS